jgi:hypothetical protein
MDSEIKKASDGLLDIIEVHNESIEILKNIVQTLGTEVVRQKQIIEKLEGDVAKLKNKTGCYP